MCGCCSINPRRMLSNLVSQLREQGAEDRYEEVLAEVRGSERNWVIPLW